jgi:glycerophosphoryl diester phosphodiesterase
VSLSKLFKQLKFYWRTILAVHLIFTAAGIAILAPLFALLLQGTLGLSGNTAVMDQDIALLLLSPQGLFIGIFLLSVFLAIAGLELGALQVVAQASGKQTPVSAMRAAGIALTNTLLLLRLTFGLTLRILIYLIPFMAAAGLTAWLLLTRYDINYYLSQHPPEFILTVAIVLALTVCLVWFLGRRLLGWSLVLPMVLLGHSTPEKAFAASERLVAGNRALCLRALATWLSLSLLLMAIPLLFLQLSIGPMLRIGGSHLASLALILGLLGVIWSLMSYLVAALNLAGFTFVIASLYQTICPGLEDNEIVGAIAAKDFSYEPGWNRRKLLLVLPLMLAIGLVYSALLLRGFDTHDDVVVIAHRGAAGAAPENTLAAINRAVADGTDWVEIDVQEARDGEIIVLHDSDFMKLSGNPMKVWEGDLEEVQQIDVGSWFGANFSDQRVPTLTEVLQAIKPSEARLVIELKYYGHDEELEQRVINLVESADMVDRVAIMSLKLEGVQKIQALRPTWTTGLLAVTAVGDITRLNVDFLAVNQSKASARFIRRAHDAGKQVFVWTVNDPISLSHWMTMGVDGVITDEPALAKSILSQLAQLSAPERLLLNAAMFFGKPEALKQYRDNSP